MSKHASLIKKIKIYTCNEINRKGVNKYIYYYNPTNVIISTCESDVSLLKFFTTLRFKKGPVSLPPKTPRFQNTTMIGNEHMDGWIKWIWSVGRPICFLSLSGTRERALTVMSWRLESWRCTDCDVVCHHLLRWGGNARPFAPNCGRSISFDIYRGQMNSGNVTTDAHEISMKSWT